LILLRGSHGVLGERLPACQDHDGYAADEPARHGMLEHKSPSIFRNVITDFWKHQAYRVLPENERWQWPARRYAGESNSLSGAIKPPLQLTACLSEKHLLDFHLRQSFNELCKAKGDPPRSIQKSLTVGQTTRQSQGAGPCLSTVAGGPMTLYKSQAKGKEVTHANASPRQDSTRAV